MKCEDVRPFLAEFAESPPRSGPLAAHIAGCSMCTGELRRYRSLLMEMAALRGEFEVPPDGFLAAMLSAVPELEPRSLIHRVATDERIPYVALSIGGMVVGATAIGLLWRKAARRTLQPAESAAS
jgi:hypothetical protein